MFLTHKEFDYLKDPIFYKGVIEDNDDPKGYGRVRVRVLGVHTDAKEDVPTSTLPWANIARSLDFGGLKHGIGISSIPQIGTWVYVFFEMGEYDRPVIIGAIAGFDVANQSLDYDYMTKHTIRTPSNHIIQIDDLNHEMRILHDNGSEVLINPANILITSVTDRTEMTIGKYEQTVMQTIQISADGSITINTGQKFNLNVNGDTNINTKGKTNIHSNGDVNISTNGKTDVKSVGDTKVQTEGTCLIESVADMTIKGATITLQSNSNTMVI
jgi:uncharacterized protein involved in type VI secretion and phage assembly